MFEPPRAILGTAQWGMPYGIANEIGRPPDDEVRRILEVAATHGVASVDTARAYGDSEFRIGNLVRDDWKIITKIPALAGTPTSELAQRHVHASLTSSHQALRRRIIDVVLLHDAQDRVSFGGAAWTALLTERTAGTIGAVGVSASSVGEALSAIEDPSLDSVQVAASIVDRRLEQSGFFDAARRRRVRVLVRSCFLQGALLLPPADVPTYLRPLAPTVRALGTIADEFGVPLGHLCLGYVRDRLGADAVIGAETALQVGQNLTWWAAPIPVGAVEATDSAVPRLPDAILDPWRWDNVAT